MHCIASVCAYFGQKALDSPGWRTCGWSLPVAEHCGLDVGGVIWDGVRGGHGATPSRCGGLSRLSNNTHYIACCFRGNSLSCHSVHAPVLFRYRECELVHGR
jgi:hypothetical protein